MIPDKASSIAFLAGLWLFVSPWIYGASGNGSAWNGWIVGAMISVFAVIRMKRPSETGLSWLNATGWLISSITGANSERMSHDGTWTT
jgi:SPW repeat